MMFSRGATLLLLLTPRLLSAEPRIARAENSLDGLQFVISLQREDESVSVLQHVKFSRGALESPQWKTEGFSPGPYKAVASPQETTFRAVCASPRSGTLTWSGNVKAKTISGNLLWEKRGQAIFYQFEGSLKTGTISQTERRTSPMPDIPNQFEGATIKLKANVYFDNRVLSHTITTRDGKRKTVGTVYPGVYKFNTVAAEKMEIIAGACRVRMDGTKSWWNYKAGEKFEVPANSSFELAVDQGLLEYLCSYDDKGK